MINKILLYKDNSKNRTQRWRYKIIAGNGEIVSVSEAYLTKWNAKRAARSLFPETLIRTEK